MTKTQIKELLTRELTVKQALEIAFQAGESFVIASHDDFMQIHCDIETVVNVLLSRIRKD